MNAEERAGPVLTRALRRVAPQQMWPVRGVQEVPHEVFAAQVLAALSPADRLAIAGITEERLADILHDPIDHALDGCPEPDLDPLCWNLAGQVLAALATPVTPEGGEPL